MALINLTPHRLNFYTPQGVTAVEVSGTLARVSSSSQKTGEVAGVPIYSTAFAEVQGLPEPQEGTFYVVSTLILTALKAAGLSRPDLVAPGTGPNDGAVRAEGKVVGVTRLVQL